MVENGSDFCVLFDLNSLLDLKTYGFCLDLGVNFLLMVDKERILLWVLYLRRVCFIFWVSLQFKVQFGTSTVPDYIVGEAYRILSSVEYFCFQRYSSYYVTYIFVFKQYLLYFIEARYLPFLFYLLTYVYFTMLRCLEWHNWYECLLVLL